MSESLNKINDVIYKRQYPISLGIPLTLSILGISTCYFYKSTRHLHYLRLVKEQLIKSINLNTIQSSTINQSAQQLSNNQLFYTHGRLIKQQQNQQQYQQNQMKQYSTIFNHNILKNDIGLYEKYEIYYKNNKYYRKGKWQNINYLQNENIILPNEIQQFRSDVITDSIITVNNHILSSNLLMSLAESNSQSNHRITLDPSSIDQKFQSLLDQIKNIQNNNNSNNNKDIEEQYKQHPFQYAINNNKHIFYQDNYIYITSKSNESSKEYNPQYSQFDLRISLQEIGNLQNVTILSQRLANQSHSSNAQDALPILDEVRIPELISKNIYYNSNRQGDKKNIGVIQYINYNTKDKNQIIEYIMNEYKGNNHILWILNGLSIYIMYLLLCDQIGEIADYKNWNIKNIEELAKNSVEKNHNNYIIHDIKLNYLSRLDFYSTVSHSIATRFFCINAILPGIAVATPLAFYWLFAFALKYKLEQAISNQINNLQEYDLHLYIHENNNKQSNSSQKLNNNHNDNKNSTLFDQIYFTKT